MLSINFVNGAFVSALDESSIQTSDAKSERTNLEFE